MPMLVLLLNILNLFNQPDFTLDKAVIPEPVVFLEQNTSTDLAEKSIGMEIRAESALLVDNNTGNILFSKDPEKKHSLASLTKLLTNLLFWEYLDQEKWDEKCLVLPEEDKQAAQIFVYQGETARIKDLIEANLVASLNNATQSLVNCLENDLKEMDFAELMNEKAKEIGMKNSVFVEPTGLSPNNVSTAEDVYLLINEFFKIKGLQEILKKKAVRFPIFHDGVSRYVYFEATNELLASFIPVYGKTGYLEESGYCFAGKFYINKNEYTVIILGEPSSEDRFNDIKALTWWVANKNFK